MILDIYPGVTFQDFRIILLLLFRGTVILFHSCTIFIFQPIMDNVFQFLCILSNIMLLRIAIPMSQMVSSLCLWHHFLNGCSVCSVKKSIWFLCWHFGDGGLYLRKALKHNLPTSSSCVLFIMYLGLFHPLPSLSPMFPLPVPHYVLQYPFYFHVKCKENVLDRQDHFFSQLSSFGQEFNLVARNPPCSIICWLLFIYFTWWIMLFIEIVSHYMYWFFISIMFIKGDPMNTSST